MEIVGWDDDAYEKPLGWEFVNSPDHINPETGAQFLSELLLQCRPEYTGVQQSLLLWITKRKR